ncbi:LIRP-like [Lycorma delicatula]|uniref:LIRP-like n=1 Tax=Lycorma delicatula TaxID=130591 RepID=UPI003F510E8C
MFTWLLLIVLYLKNYTNCQSNGYTSTRNRTRDGSIIIRLCGSDLANKIDSECHGVFKKSNTESNLSVKNNWLKELEILEELNELNFPLRTVSRFQALNLPSKNYKRKARGVAYECCDKPCFLYELWTYCGNKP